jgi:hypothetical protein
MYFKKSSPDIARDLSMHRSAADNKQWCQVTPDQIKLVVFFQTCYY